MLKLWVLTRAKLKTMVKTKVKLKTMAKKKDGEEGWGRKDGSSIPAPGVSLGQRQRHLHLSTRQPKVAR